MYQVFNNVISAEIFEKLYDQLSLGAGWSFSGTSNSKTANFIWYKDLNKNTYFSETLFKRIKLLIGNEYQLLRVYANGQTFGLPGSLHVDSVFTDRFTFLIYANKTWHSTWGGHTIIQNESGMFDSVIPIPNAGLFFDSRIPHCGLDPTSHCKDLRITIAYKLKKVGNND